MAYQANAAAYSFETTVPTEWNNVSSGTLSISSARYKFETKSLRWDWSAGSVIAVTSPDNLASCSRLTAGGIDGWIYNENPAASSLVFEFYNASSVKKCSLAFSLNFKGWRRVCVRFSEDLNYDRTQLQSMKVVAPASGSGSIYFDAFEFTSDASWERISDMQYTVRANAGNPDIDNFLESRNTPKSELPATVSAAEKAAYSTILGRFEEWYIGTNRYASNPSYKARYNAINNSSGSTYISRARSKMAALPLSTDGDGIVVSKGLYPVTVTAINGVSVDIFRTYSEQYLLPLAYDWRLNGRSDSRDYLLKMFDWYNNQGWADGSALGSIRFEKLRSGGYFHSVFLLRDALSAAQREREMQTVYWYSLFGDCYKTPDNKGETADNIRTLAAAKLIYALMQTDDKERARALQAFAQYMENALSVAPGYLGTFKGDYSGYHHRAAYASSYAPDALYMGSLIYYLLHGTPYQLSQQVYNTLKGSLVQYYDFICTGYDVPQALKGRFPDASPILHELLPAMAFLSLSNAQPDADLAGALKRLWKPGEEPVKSWLATVNTDITFKNTPGAIAAILEAMDNDIAAAPAQQGNRFYPYAGTMVSKSGSWHTNIKGFSKYIWDFEGGSNENLYGRYMSNGTVQLKNPDLNLDSHEVGNTDWDWARFPGATAKYLPKASLDFGGTYHRNFSDKAFLGGVAVDDSLALFSVQLHDNTFDKSFYANKSVFIFGKNSYHLGSNIRCTAASNNIETTLFQSLRSAGDARINGQTLSAGDTDIEQPTLQDCYGSTFIVHEGLVDASLNASFATAVINHGKQPTAGRYRYSLLPAASGAELAKMQSEATHPVEVLQANDTAHIMRHKEYNATAYAVFVKGKVAQGMLDSVNTPALIMVRQFGDSLYHIVFSDPGMRRKSAARNDVLSYADAAVPSDSFDIEIRLSKALTAVGSTGIVSVDTLPGTTIISARVTEGQSHTLVLRDKKAGDNPHTSAASNAQDERIAMFPNPTKGELRIAGLAKEATIKIFDIGGKLQLMQRVSAGEATINMAPLAKGMYIVAVFIDGKKIAAKQIVKQ